VNTTAEIWLQFLTNWCWPP